MAQQGSPAGQGAKVNRRAIDVQAQYDAADRVGQFAPFAAHGVKALGPRGEGAQIQA